jgi:hypothetical protein
MKTISFPAAKTEINLYLQNDIFNPFFIVIDDIEQYADALAEYSSLSCLNASTFCAENDSFPDIDAIINYLYEITSPTLILGLGETVSLSGKEETLDGLKDKLFSAKIIILCRNVRDKLKKIADNDKKFSASDKKCIIFLKSGVHIKIVKFQESLNLPAINGFKNLLAKLENGTSDSLKVITSLNLNDVREVNTAYEAIRYFKPNFRIPQNVISDSLWEEYLDDSELDGFALDHWRTYLKYRLEPIKDIYLKYVIEKSVNYDMYKKQIYSALLDFKYNDKRFLPLYNARKAVLKNIKNTDIADYISETKIKDNQRIYYLTNLTLIERQEIINALDCVENIPNELKYIYPALYEYLFPFSFNCENSKLFSEYFTEYKRQKITNKLNPDFYEKVKDLATDGHRPYNSLKSRGEVLDSLNKDNTLLFWVDALGSEYLGYIQNRSKMLGLKITIHTVRANLPSITSENKDFYESWSGNDRIKTKELDELKHSGETDYNYQTTKTPIHLATELDIIDKILDQTTQKLRGKTYDKVILASDHGASRLAVISQQECIWELSSKGEHCGRCCPNCEADVKSEYATEENGFWVLANYDRFKGSRKASVEVHGGATLEEVIIPLIEIELFDSRIEITNTTPEVTASYRKNAEVVLFSKNKLKKVSLRINGKIYPAKNIGDNKYKIELPNIKKTGAYIADVLEGDSLIGEISFNVIRESGKSNDTDWF